MPTAAAIVVLFLILPALGEEDAPETLDSAQSGHVWRDWVSGRYETRLDAKWSRRDSDVDLIQSLQLDVTPPRYERLRLRGLVWSNADLGGRVDATSALRDINDAYNSRVRTRLLYLYAEFDDVWGDSVLRVGRQRILESVANARIDGVYFRQQRAGWNWYAFAGARATFYFEGDDELTAGGGFSWSVSPRTRVAIDGIYSQETRDRRLAPRSRLVSGHLWTAHAPRRLETNFSDTLVSASVWQQLTDNLQLFGRLRLKDGKPDEIMMRAMGWTPQWDLTYEVRYINRLKTARDRVDDISVYYGILGAYGTYHDLYAALHKQVMPRLILSLETQLRDSRGRGPGWSNRDFWRTALMATAKDVAPNMDVRAGLEYWNVSGGAGRWAVTGEVARTWGPFRLIAGAGYERYRDRLTEYRRWPHDLNLALVSFVPGYYATRNPLVFLLDRHAVKTDEDIYSVYARGRWAMRDNQDVTLGITYEDYDGPDSPYWRAYAGYGIRF